MKLSMWMIANQLLELDPEQVTACILRAAREPYALTIIFAFLIFKGVLLLKDTKNK